MHKAIEKVEAYKMKTITAALDKAKSEMAEAVEWYRDTGYDRYYNKMQRKEHEIDELEAYLNRNNAIEEAIKARAQSKEEIATIKKTLKNKLFYLLAAIPECSEGRSIQEYLETL